MVLGDSFQLQHGSAASIGEGGQPSIFPEEKAGCARLKPDTTGSGQKNSVDFSVGHSSVGGFFHRLKAHSIKAEDAGRRGEPEISIGRLLDVEDSSQAIFRCPHGVMKVRQFRSRGPGG